MLRRLVKVDTNDVTHVYDKPPAGQLTFAEFQLTRFKPDPAKVLVQKVAPGPFDPALRQIDGVSPVRDLRLALAAFRSSRPECSAACHPARPSRYS